MEDNQEWQVNLQRMPYQQVMDFIANSCAFHKSYRILHSTLHDAFDKHRTVNGTYPSLHVSRKTFSAIMKSASEDLGLACKRMSGGVYYLGLALKVNGIAPPVYEPLTEDERFARKKIMDKLYYEQHKHEINGKKAAIKIIDALLEEEISAEGVATLHRHKLFGVVYKIAPEAVDWSRGKTSELIHHYVDIDATVQDNLTAYRKLQRESMLTANEIEENQRQTSALFRSVMLSTGVQTGPKPLRLKILTNQTAVVDIPNDLTPLRSYPAQGLRHRVKELHTIEHNSPETSPEKVIIEPEVGNIENSVSIPLIWPKLVQGR